MRRHLFSAGALALVLVASPALADDLDLSGTYTLTGKDRNGRFRGAATLVQDGSGRVLGNIRMDYERWSWSSFGYELSGRVGTARLDAQLRGHTLRGRRYTTTGLTDVIAGLDNAESFAITYGVAARTFRWE